MDRVVIAGCGYVGSELARTLQSKGFDVLGLRRSSVAEGFPSIAADLLQPETYSAQLAQGDTLVYSVAADSRTEEHYRMAYVQGLETILSTYAVNNLKLTKILFTSSTGVYGQNGGELVDEDSVTEPLSFTGAIMLEGERVVRSSGVPFSIARFGGIYGPGRLRLVQMVKSADFRLAETIRYTNRIHRDDCAGVLAHLLTISQGGVFNGVDQDPADQNDVLRWIAQELSVLVPAESTGIASLPAVGKRCSSSKIRSTGYEFRYPSFREGYADMIKTL